MQRTLSILPVMLAALAAPVQAVEPADPSARLPVVLPLLTEVRVAREEPPPAVLGKRVDLAALGESESRGASDNIRNEATLGGTVGNNSATNVSSGMNIIDNGSFANASGLPVVIQNSGANVLIQNATVINLQLQ
jgi:hypothetical protein